MGRRKIAKGDKLTGRVLSRGASDMTEGVIWKQLLQFSVPMAVGLLFQQLYNTVDAVVVGNFVGKEALAAVGSTSSIINMLVGLSAGLSTGASVLISQRYGAHDDRGLRDAVHTSIAATLVLCVFATAVGMLIVDPMLATGGSAEAAISELKKRGCRNLKLMVLLAAPEGIQRIQKTHPDVDIYCGAVDDHLNEHGYIVPGLGDAGDRIFGTK